MENVAFDLGAVGVGEPLRYSSLTVFPLYHQAEGSLPYMLGDQAFEAGKIALSEANQGGIVSTISMKNKGDSFVLFLEGQQLEGAKQNRVLNTSVLIPPQREINVPVSCVEQKRWAYESREFSPSETAATSSLRYALRRSVSRSVSTGRGHTSDQSEVWSKIESQQRSLATSSPTSALADTYSTHSEELAPYEAEVPYADGSRGLAIAIGTRLVSIDLYDKASTCERQWRKLIKAAALDAIQKRREGLAESAGDDQNSKAPVHQLLGSFGSASWIKATPPGAGVEYRTTLQGYEASLLYFEQEPLWFGAVAMA